MHDSSSGQFLRNYPQRNHSRTVSEHCADNFFQVPVLNISVALSWFATDHPWPVMAKKKEVFGTSPFCPWTYRCGTVRRMDVPIKKNEDNVRSTKIQQGQDPDMTEKRAKKMRGQKPMDRGIPKVGAAHVSLTRAIIYAWFSLTSGP